MLPPYSSIRNGGIFSLRARCTRAAATEPRGCAESSGEAAGAARSIMQAVSGRTEGLRAVFRCEATAVQRSR